MSQAGTVNSGYDTIAKSLHWVVAVVVLSMLIFGRQLDDMADAERVEMIKFHSGLGMSVLILMVLRLLWRCDTRRLRRPPLWLAGNGVRPFRCTARSTCC